MSVFETNAALNLQSLSVESPYSSEILTFSLVLALTVFAMVVDFNSLIRIFVPGRKNSRSAYLLMFNWFTSWLFAYSAFFLIRSFLEDNVHSSSLQVKSAYVICQTSVTYLGMLLGIGCRMHIRKQKQNLIVKDAKIESDVIANSIIILIGVIMAYAFALIAVPVFGLSSLLANTLGFVESSVFFTVSRSMRGAGFKVSRKPSRKAAGTLLQDSVMRLVSVFFGILPDPNADPKLMVSEDDVTSDDSSSSKETDSANDSEEEAGQGTTTTRNSTTSSSSSSPLPPMPPVSELWLIHGKYYDLRSFVKRHPGGERAIKLGQGRDCTELFETYHPFTQKHHKMLKLSRCYGPVAPSSAEDTAKRLKELQASPPRSQVPLEVQAEADYGREKFDWERTPFLDDALVAARRYFSPRGDESDHEVIANSKATPRAWVQHAVGMAAAIFAAWRFVAGDLAAVFYFPLVYWIVCSDLMHNGSHFGQSTVPWVNTLCSYLGSLHVQHHLWAVQHVVGHHVYTNMVNLDPDVHHFAQDKEKMMPGYRSHPLQTYLAKYSFAWKFALVFQMNATTIALALLNIPKYLTEGKVETTAVMERDVKSVKLDRSLLLLSLAAFLYCHGVGPGLVKLVWAWSIHGMLFNIFSQISHVNELCMDGPAAYAKQIGRDKIEWAAHELLTANDYSCDSWFWNTISINLNGQVCHHLFPSVHPVHYPALRRVLLPVAKKHGLDYEGRSSGTFFSVFARYLRWLVKINQPREGAKGAQGAMAQGAAVMKNNLFTAVSLTMFWGLTVVLPAYSFFL